jgi:alcohol dehydrogenase
VPGHELAGVIEAVGSGVRRWQPGARITVPFVCGCGTCEMCRAGQHQICDHQTQPGFTHWGSFAEYVRIDRADVNSVELPESIDFITAACLGCRFTTSFRAVVAKGRCAPGQWLAVHGCGGVGLSAIMIARAMGAQIIAIDVRDCALTAAADVGADVTINARQVDDVAAAIADHAHGGAHVSIDALGSRETCLNSIGCLRKQGRHVQVGLMVGDDAQCPMPLGPFISKELELCGSHGLAAREFATLLAMIAAGRLDPKRLVHQTVTLEQGAALLMTMDDLSSDAVGITVIDEF